MSKIPHPSSSKIESAGKDGIKRIALQLQLQHKSHKVYQKQTQTRTKGMNYNQSDPSKKNPETRFPLSMMETEEEELQHRHIGKADGRSEHHDDHWNQSIQRNNQGISAFLQGNLIVAHRLFAEASVLQRMAFDDDERDGLKPYRCKWVTIHSSAFHNLHLSLAQTNNMSRLFMFFLRIQHQQEEASEDSANNEMMPPPLPRVAPDVLLANVHWAVDFNLALTSQLLGIVLSPSNDQESRHYRALSFGIYEQIEHDVVDWFDDDGLAPLPVAIFVMAIYNNQGAMFCQLDVQTQMEIYWGRMRKIWNRASHLLLRKALVCSLFQGNLRYLEAKHTQTAGAA